MREKLKNEIMLLLDKNVNVETLRNLEPYIDMILSNYDI